MLGLGKVLAVRGDVVTAYFKDHRDAPRAINVAVVPMEIPDEQTDPWLDEVDPSKKSKKGWSRKPKTKTPPNPPKRKKAK